MKLVIGNKNYSTWSLRPWLLLKINNIDFNEVQESLISDGLSERLAQYSPSARVPVLIDDSLVVWDSLAICEYVSERCLNGAGWPLDIIDRAKARAVVAEMHSGFSGLRNELPMNIRAKRRVELSEQARKDISRVDEIWSQCRQQYQERGEWLFGEFSIADCFYAPVVMRFVTYDIKLSSAADTYVKRLQDHPAMREWIAGALQETEVVAEDEAGVDVLPA